MRVGAVAVLLIALSSVGLEPARTDATGPQDPSFARGELYETGSWPVSTAIADVTGDGRADVLLTTRYYSDPPNDYKLFIFAQQPDGSLGAPAKFDTDGIYNTAQDAGIDTGDVNGDAKTDAVVATSAGVDIFYQSAGSLSAPSLLPTQYPAQEALLRDFDGDGTVDLAVDTGGTGGAGSALLIYPGTGTGFDVPTTLTIRFQTQIEAADVTGDGRLDVIGCDGNSSFCSTNTLNVFVQQADGSFVERHHSAPVISWNVVCHLGVGDVTGDGRTDVLATVCGNQPGSLIDVLPQLADGSLGRAAPYHVYDADEPVAVADVNADGRGDAVTLHDCHVGVLLQRSDGTLTGAETLYLKRCASHNAPRGLAIGDVSGDGLADIVEAQASGSSNGLLILRQVPTASALSVQTSPATVGYRADVHVSAHLGQALAGTVVHIYERDLSGITVLEDSAAVEPGGVFSITVPGREDAVFEAASESLTSNEKLVLVHARTTGFLGGYALSGRFHLFHYHASCSTSHRRCPKYRAHVAPNHSGQPVLITVQAYRSSAWRTVKEMTKYLSPRSYAVTRLAYSVRDRGVRMRVQGRFVGDQDHLGSQAPWSYFKITR
jgi:FG-GAP-like repeat